MPATDGRGDQVERTAPEGDAERHGENGEQEREGFWQRLADWIWDFWHTRTRTTTVVLVVVFLVLFGVYGYTSQVYGEHNKNPLIAPVSTVPEKTVTQVVTEHVTTVPTPAPPPSSPDAPPGG